MSNFIINTFSRIIARHDIHIPKVINENRWISLTYKLTEKSLDSQSKVLIRLATKEDLNLLVSLEENEADTGYHIASQMIRFWNDYGLRCLYVGYLEDDPIPFCWQYFIENSDINRRDLLKVAGMGAAAFALPGLAMAQNTGVCYWS